MCWTGPVSTGMATIGFGGAILAKLKEESWMRWGTLAYFSYMEMLQAFTYSVIGICAITGTSGGKWNETLTYLSYIHICTQPIFTNLFGLSFSQKGEGLKKWLKIVMPISFISVLLMLSKMYFHGVFGHCDVNDTALCGSDACSYHGEWHIAWRLSLNAIDEWNILGYKVTWLVYSLPVFALPLFYGGWRWSLYHFTFGLFTARMLTSNKDEYASIWCLSSIAMFLTIYIPVIRNWMETPLRENELKKKF